jgi:hypothetical protein
MQRISEVTVGEEPVGAVVRYLQSQKSHLYLLMDSIVAQLVQDKGRSSCYLLFVS